MGKKFLEVRAQGKRRVLDASDMKAIHYYQKKKTPTLPKYIDSSMEEEAQCGSPTETLYSLEEPREVIDEMFLS